MPSRRAAALWALAIAYAAGIFVLSSSPVPETVEEPVRLLGTQVLHFVEFAVLAFLLALAFATIRSLRVRFLALLLGGVVAVLYAASDEAHQLFVPGRQGDVVDFLWDSAGAVVGAVLGGAVQLLWSRRASRAAALSGTSPR